MPTRISETRFKGFSRYLLSSYNNERFTCVWAAGNLIHYLRKRSIANKHHALKMSKVTEYLPYVMYECSC